MKKEQIETAAKEFCEAEEWRDIPGQEGYYQVSNFGRIKTVSRRVESRPQVYITIPEKIRKIGIDSNGYSYVNFSKLGKQTTGFLHRCIAMAFIPNPENKKEVNHIDGNKQNNDISNLEWNTPLENSTHAWNMGLKTHFGENSNKCKFSDQTVEAIRQMKSDNPTMTTAIIGKIFGVSQNHVSLLLSNKTRKRLTTKI
jgi:hypothetical protein